jgi:UDP-glucose 4-epimerase
MTILVTGGAGYIGIHTVVELAAQKYNIVIVDNFCNSSPEAVRRAEQITGQKITLYEGDVRDKNLLDRIFQEQEIGAVLHFAGLKAVGESVEKPLTYYRNNIDSTLALCEAMQDAGVGKLIFSSSATVYGDAPNLPWTEAHRTGQGITNPYGQTKYMIEQILRDLAHADPAWQITSLRYFNPIGAHVSGQLGEDPSDKPNNLMPYIDQVAVGKRDKLQVFGNDYDTPDGTGVRDYIHVVDLARGHTAALTHLDKNAAGAMSVYNLGTGHGTSVLELVNAFKTASGQNIPYEIAPRRQGDLPEYYADASKANQSLNWHTEKSIEDACADTWRWQSQNPNGYKS